MTTVATMANETAKTIGKIEIIEITFFKFPKILDFWLSKSLLLIFFS